MSYQLIPGEDRLFQIIAQQILPLFRVLFHQNRLNIKIGIGVWNAVSISFFCRGFKSGIDGYNPSIRLYGKRLYFLTQSAAASRLAIYTNWNIEAKASADVSPIVIRKSGIFQLVQDPKSERGVTATAAQPGARRNILDNRESVMMFKANITVERLIGPGDQILVICGNRAAWHGKRISVSPEIGRA